MSANNGIEMESNNKTEVKIDAPLDAGEQLIVSFVIVGIVVISSGLAFLLFR